MADKVPNQPSHLGQEPMADNISTQAAQSTPKPDQQSPAKKAFQRKPKAKDPMFSMFEKLSPSDRQRLQAAAETIGGKCSILSQTIGLPSQGKSLEKPKLVRNKFTGEEGHLLIHAQTDDAHSFLIDGMGMTKGFMTYDPSAAANVFEPAVPDSSCPNLNELNPLHLGAQGEGFDNSPIPAAIPFQLGQHVGQNIGQLDPNARDFSPFTVDNGMIDQNHNGGDANVFQHFDFTDPLFQPVGLTEPLPFPELPLRAANVNMLGTGRPRIHPPVQEHPAFAHRTSKHSHDSYSKRASGILPDPKRLFHPTSFQQFSTEKRLFEPLQAVDSPLPHGGTSSSPTAQASLRRQNNTQISYIKSPTVPKSQNLSSSFPKSSILSPTVTVPRASSSSSIPSASVQHIPSSQSLAVPHAPVVVNGISLINPKETIPDRFHAIFPYEVFNAVQSKCFKSIYTTNDNVIVSAPTSSGKTVLLELAVCRLVNQKGSENAKIVYIAPTKALCKEKAEQWRKLFGIMSVPVSELTGDTSRAEVRMVREAKIIVTTPEKWDSVTRSWIDHRRLLDLVELFLIDEVHILKESRGATLEAVVSRMKTYGSKVRFIALSATIPNSADIASWLGRDHANPNVPAQREVFGEEFRPVKLQKIVHGIETKLADHPFDGYLNSQLWKYIEMHTQRKPMLIFCMTRKSCRNAAEELAKQWSQRQPSARLWPQPRKVIPVIDVGLQELVRYGVAFHHAGLEPDDRKTVHKAFKEGHLSVICCTSTLAVGINLPCHTVVLKGTVSYQDGGRLCEYSDLEVMQMLGRAGRPQYENSALAIILTRSRNAKRYEDLGSGQQILESTLHKNLIEHLNSEISLGTFQTTRGAKNWLKSTFLSVRLHQNPSFYGDLNDAKLTQSPKTVDHQLEEICEAAIGTLRDSCLIKGNTKFQHTDYGRAMSKYMIRFETMRKILELPRAAKTQVILNALCEAREFNEIRWQASERDMFRDINKDPFIMYPIDSTVGTVAHKISLLIQIELGRVDLTNINGLERQRLRAEAGRVLDVMHRLIRTVIECKGSDADGTACWAALDLARSMTAKAWENRPMQLLQVPQLGPVLMRKLVSHNIRTVSQLADSAAGDIERIASRNPPFGKKMADALAFFPRLTIGTAIKDSQIDPNGHPVIHVDTSLGFSNARGKWAGKTPIVTLLATTTEGIACYFYRESLNAFSQDHNTREIHFTWIPNSVQETVTCQFACEGIVGTVVSTKIRHNLPASAFLLRTQKDRLHSSELQIPVPSEISSNCFSVTDEIDDEDMLEILNSFSCKSAFETPEDVEDDIDDDVLLALSDQHGTLADMPLKGLKGIQNRARAALAGEDYQGLPRHVFSTGAAQQNQGAVTKLSRKSQNSERSTKSLDSQSVEDEAIRLPNGNYKCGHPCSQVGGGTTARGDRCGHDCCRNGSKHPPRKRKINGKRRDKIGDEAHASSQAARGSPSLNPPPKRVKTNGNAQSTAMISSSVSISSASQSRLSPTQSIVYHSTYNADEESIIDLTSDYEGTSRALRRARPPRVLTTGSDDKKRSPAKELINTDAISIETSNDTSEDVGIALAATYWGKGACLHSQRSDSIDYSNALHSLIQINEMQDRPQPTFNASERQGRLDPKGKPSRDEEHVCDAIGRSENGSTKQAHVAQTTADFMFGDISPSVMAIDKTVMNRADGDGEPASFSPVGARVARPKTQRKIGPLASNNSFNAAITNPHLGQSGVDEVLATPSKAEGEPEWVNEFDPAFISEFRGLVEFI